MPQNPSDSPDELEYEIPLRDQRFFGSGLKRKRIVFVPPTSSDTGSNRLPDASSSTVADRYLKLVLEEETANPSPQDGANLVEETDQDAVGGTESPPAKNARCDICGHAISDEDPATSHDSSIVHQICLKHSHPPSNVDRRRKGLAVLESQGWDPDGRTGLGVGGKGILHPVKNREYPARAGLGAKPEVLKKVQKPVKLDAGKVRLLEQEGKKKAERIREAFFRSEDVLRYLGER